MPHAMVDHAVLTSSAIIIILLVRICWGVVVDFAVVVVVVVVVVVPRVQAPFTLAPVRSTTKRARLALFIRRAVMPHTLRANSRLCILQLSILSVRLLGYMRAAF